MKTDKKMDKKEVLRGEVVRMQEIIDEMGHRNNELSSELMESKERLTVEQGRLEQYRAGMETAMRSRDFAHGLYRGAIHMARIFRRIPAPPSRVGSDHVPRDPFEQI